MEKYCITLDWLQVCGSLKKLDWWQKHFDNRYAINTPVIDSTTGLYTLSIGDIVIYDTGRSTRTFRHLVSINRVVNSSLVELATLQIIPVSSALNPHLCILKMDNRTLYSEDCFSLLSHLLNKLGITYKGITRLDIAYDCNYFKGGRKPANFLRQYVCTPVSSSKYITRKHTKKFAVVFNRENDKKNEVEYIRWGSDGSPKCCYMYDKSIELNNVKDKPWIRAMWEKNGLISDDDTHVFRSEISIKCDGMDILNLETGELFKLSVKYLENQAFIERLFHTYAKQMFCFAQRNDHTRIRDFDVIDLFENVPTITAKPHKYSIKADTGRTEKICANKLYQLLTSYTDCSDQFYQSIRDCINFLSEVSSNREILMRIKDKADYLAHLQAYQFSGASDKSLLAARKGLSELAQYVRDSYNLNEEYALYRDIEYYLTHNHINEY